MSLHSEKWIYGYKWDELHIDEYVIERVESLAEQEEQPIMHQEMPSFEWSPGTNVKDSLERSIGSDAQLEYEGEARTEQEVIEEVPHLLAEEIQNEEAVEPANDINNEGAAEDDAVPEENDGF